MLPSFLRLRGVVANHAQPYHVFFLLPIFLCCAASLPCKRWEVKGSGSIIHCCSVRGHILPSQRCRNVTFNPFIILFLSLRLTSPESAFLPRLNHCSPVFFFSLNRQEIFTPQVKLKSVSAVHMPSCFHSAHLPYTLLFPHILTQASPWLCLPLILCCPL